MKFYNSSLQLWLSGVIIVDKKYVENVFSIDNYSRNSKITLINGNSVMKRSGIDEMYT